MVNDDYSMSYENLFVQALAITFLSELFVAILLVRFFYQTILLSYSRLVLVCFVVNALTLIYFWFLAPFYITNHQVYIYGGESIIILTEAFLYSQFLSFSWKKSFIISLAANLVSIGVGVLLYI